MWTLKIILYRMKAMLNICKKAAQLLPVLLLASACLLADSCEGQYDELPPKTDATIRYALPYPETPTSEEIEEFRQIRAEYEEATY